MDGSERPASFAEDLAQNRAAWVFDHGLPPLPELVAAHEQVPVAFWTSERWAAVHYLYGASVDAEFPDEPPCLYTETEGFRRRGDGWEPAGGGSGTDWPWPGLELRRPDVDARYAAGGECWYGEGDWAVGCMDGVAGSAAAVVELEQSGRISSRPLDSPIGAWVVSFDGYLPAILQLRDDHGEVLYVQRFEPPILRP